MNDNLYSCEIRNTRYLTDEDYMIAAAYGISHRLAYSRFYNEGWDKQRAIKTPPKDQKKIKKEALSQYPDLYERLDKLGISYQAFYKRIKDKHMSIEQAITTPRIEPKGNLKPHKFGSGRISLEQFQIAEKNGIKIRTVKCRVYQYGWSIEDAITKPPRKKSDWNSKYYPKK